ncbi:bifunctional riboflavin kinase/FAD synthetase [Sphingomonas sp. CGMCC 1.13654]|uniref:Riboflavin biosynthesis protein n=1 Tax=Sphingomonas chungangi TaxID=2683589 RepID=A0A838L0B4_9SPHN|nr:bifunctional riboflavin kinase/FAD synthetase [Sphingomonas chungangi]MBA2932781.1 bifunctional riboflavin kinase/FAD synthetase [Sphingomonas chungangi]MVW56403.1 bifunctional riboflavin kinase/FAD synthetase [Sphingomonas chungangi]
MERLPGDRPVPDRLRGGVVALGNFDGFHVGHQAVVGRALALARETGVPALVATFDPHPARLFKPDAPPFLLTRIDQRMDLFEAFGMDGALALPFDHALAALGPERFMAEWLVERIGASALVTGEDFTFGKDRGGNTALLRSLAHQRGMLAETIAPVEADGGVASSTRIRDSLRAGDPQAAARLLTRPFAIRGAVQHGDKLGRTIGYPTANVAIGDYLRPAYGVYAVRGRLADGRVVDGAANLGVRPQFDPPKELLEPYFFDFSGDLYGQTIEIELIEYLRPEAKFDGLDALVAQIDADCAKARDILAGNPAAL